MAAPQQPQQSPKPPAVAGTPTSPEVREAPKRRMGKFRLLAGDYITDKLDWMPRDQMLAYAKQAQIPEPEKMTDAVLKAEVRKSRVAEKRWGPGQVVASPKPLASRWPEKFQRIGDDVPESQGKPTLRVAEPELEESYTEVGAQETWEAEHANDDLARLGLTQLRELAYEEGIDLGTAQSRPAILSTIRRARAAIAQDR